MNGFTTSWANNLDDPTDIVYLSSDHVDTTDVNGNTVKGAWVFISSSSTVGAVGNEVMATMLLDAKIEEIIDSIQFDPDE